MGIGDVLWYYLEGYAPEEIVANLPDLSLEQIHAAITYYLHNRSTMDAYLHQLEAWRSARYAEWVAHPSPLIERLRSLKKVTSASLAAVHENPLSSSFHALRGMQG